MRSIGLKTLLGTAAILLATSGAQAGAISANPNPISFDAGFGKITVGGEVSGLAFYQSNPMQASRGDNETSFDADNAMVTVQKSDGMFQFYVQAGLYSFPTVGQPYVKANDQNSFLGAVPVAYGKLQLSDTFSVSAGKLPTLVGAELAFTPNNANIERGLLWWQEPVVSRGVQVNYASGPLSVAVSWNDGYYTNLWNTFSGLASYAIDSSNTIAFDASITSDTHLSLGHQIYNLMYTYSSGPLSFGPYLQYEHYDHSGGSEWGIGALASYQFTPVYSVNGRVEYEDSSGAGSPFSYGPKSSAWSITITPTWQKSLFFIRGDLSYVGLSKQTFGFGTSGTKSDQFRAMLETGVVF